MTRDPSSAVALLRRMEARVLPLRHQQTKTAFAHGAPRRAGRLQHRSEPRPRQDPHRRRYDDYVFAAE